ncbi:MAG: hypothetical protein R3F14_15865 [Polyangiaceae bacterium]
MAQGRGARRGLLLSPAGGQADDWLAGRHPPRALPRTGHQAGPGEPSRPDDTPLDEAPGEPIEIGGAPAKRQKKAREISVLFERAAPCTAPGCDPARDHRLSIRARCETEAACSDALVVISLPGSGDEALACSDALVAIESARLW